MTHPAPTIYEITAISEDSLGQNITCGSKFVMPALADTCFIIKDDDSSLSGDRCRNENADDHSFQTAVIEQNGQDVGNGGQIYAEKYFWVCDENGNWYVMIEIEQEGSHDDFFTFYTGHGYTVPPAGAQLTVGSACNVGGSWVKYDLLGSGDCPPATGSISGTVFCDTDCDGLDGTVTVIEGHDYVIEAEDMHETGFRTVHGDQASGGELIKLNCAGGTGKLWTDFQGKKGVYDVTIRVQDENDGKSVIQLKVGGVYVDAVRLDEDDDGIGSDNGGFSTFVIKDVALDKGDQIKLVVDGDGHEFVRIDNITLEGQDQTVVVDDPRKAGVVIKLLDADGNPVLDGNGEPITTVTDAEGNYQFDNLPVGGYKIMGVAPDGTEFTVQDVNGNGNDDRDSDVDANGTSGLIRVVAGETADVDLGLCDKPFRECDDPDAVKIDFEGINGVAFAAGTVIAAQYAEWGVTIEAQRDRNNTAENDAMVFDSGNPTGGDTDLATTTQGNILIVSEDNDSSDPDDAVGGVITFTFDNPSKIFDIKVIDTEEGGTITATLENGDTVTFDIPRIGDGDIAQVILDLEGVTELTVELDGSGAIDDLCFVPGNADPVATDDAGMACVGDAIVIDLADNITDADGDAVSIVSVAGQAITDGGPAITVGNDTDGFVFVALNGTELTVTAADQGAFSLFGDLGLGEQSDITFSYGIEDSAGNTASANVTVTYKGAYETLGEFAASLPTGVIEFKLEQAPAPDLYTLLFTDAGGDTRLEGVEFPQAYCLAAFLPPLVGSSFDVATPINGTLSILDDTSVLGSGNLPFFPLLSDVNADVDADELDNIINYILNTDWESQGYTDEQVQGAIWGITDSFLGVAGEPFPSVAAQEILNDAIANGQDFEVSQGDIVGVYIDPADRPADLPADADWHEQPFVIGLLWEECVC